MRGKFGKKRIAIVGAGRSGLAAIKCCKEAALDVVCFEKTDSIGGFWKYREDSIKGVASCMKSTVNIYSKEMDAFSDFPPPDDFPNYMNHGMMMEYLDMYAEQFELYDCIRYEHEILSIVPSEKNSNSGAWKVKYQYIVEKQKEIQEELFDGVMICCGRRSHPKIPVFKGLDKFGGKTLHSQQVKSVMEFDKKNVLVIGFGNSAVDAAVDISVVAKQVYISTRTGGWIVPKVGAKGYPSDSLYLRRKTHFLYNLCRDQVCRYIESAIHSRLDHEMYGIKPDHDILSKHPVINEDLPDKILTGRIIVKGDVEKFTENGAVFNGEDKVFPIDVVIFATGYEMRITFLEDNIWKTENELSLYKFVFPLSSEQQNIAFIGFVNPLGPLGPVVESQCRFSALVLGGKLKLPADEDRREDFCLTKARLSERFVSQPSCFPQVDFIEYMDELTSLFDARPNISGLFMKSPLLYWTCFSGPCLPYQYRLQGPHLWQGAGKAIMEYEDRTRAPLQKKLDNEDTKRSTDKSGLHFLSLWL